MDGHEYIRVYDNLLHPRIVESLREANEVDTESLKFSSRLAIRSAVNRYVAEFPHMTRMNSIDLGGDDFVIATVSSGGMMQCASKSVDSTRCIASLILFLDDSCEVSFPVHRMKVGGRVGRIVVFPAHWTHPYQYVNAGTVLTTNLTYLSD